MGMKTADDGTFDAADGPTAGDYDGDATVMSTVCFN
jgi:hypothetical protein